MLETGLYRGCPRYFNKGCSFCSEPFYGKPVFREQKHIANEIKVYHKEGINHFRLGAQSCTISYKAKGIGEKDPPEPVPKEIKKLFKEIWEKAPNIKVLHLDNANPAVISKYPKKSKEIIETIVKETTPGNVLAFGLETADKEVIQKNNLNTTPKQTIEAIKVVNKLGKERGKNGLPKLLPGLNFLGGLKGEKPQTYQKNLDFLKKIKKQGLLLRRINIRKVLSHQKNFKLNYKKEYKVFKQRVREQIDKPLLKKVAPKETILRDVFLEKKQKNKVFGRQIATYPLLVGINQSLETNQFIDVIITDHGYRSVTGLKHPIKLKETSFDELKQIPGIGKKRAAKLFRKQPRNKKELKETIKEKETQKSLLKYLELN